MKLFDFKVSDKHKLLEDQIKSIAADSAAEEAERRGWAPDYQVRRAGEPETGRDGETVYHFEVIGTFLSGDDDESQRKPTGPKAPKKPDVAASEESVP
jgi:hypothetical protein